VLPRRSSLLEVRFNSEWLDMSMEELFRLVRTTTVATAARAQGLRRALWGAHADLGARAAVSAAAGLRLGRVRADVELGAPTRPST